MQAQPLSVHLLGAGDVQPVMALSWQVLALCTLHAFVRRKLLGKIRNSLGGESGTSLLPPSNAAALTHRTYPPQHFPIVFAAFPR